MDVCPAAQHPIQEVLTDVCKLLKKGAFFSVYAMKAHRGRRGITPIILNF
jgi:hypothetical protein